MDPQTYWVVTKVEITDHNWEYYRRTQNLYGKAWGDFYRKGQLITRDGLVELAGTYEWVLVAGPEVGGPKE